MVASLGLRKDDEWTSRFILDGRFDSLQYSVLGIANHVDEEMG